ncbi:MAG: hypothetical protein JRF70_16505 [Deltaproteobacteria bacterium]|nr:hypothetical protein [Deltaproteobacteria bacterium]
MRKIGILAIGLLLFGQTAGAATWSIIGFSVKPQDVAAVTAAADALMSSAAGKAFPGRLFLQVNVADGDNPATHAFVPVYNTAAEREASGATFRADPAWATFQKTMTAKTEPVSNVMYRTVQRWGDISDDDTGQVFLSSVVAGGITPVSHVISVGEESEAAIEATEKIFQGSADWATYLAASQKAADYLGNNMVRTMKTWGVSLDEATAQ